jgi:hypothetical protein
LAELFANYRESLVAHGIRTISRYPYAFGYFDNGTLVNKLQRAAFACNLQTFGLTNPFRSDGPFYRWASQRHLQSRKDSIGDYGRKAYNPANIRIRIVNSTLRLALRALGPDRYTILMKYLEYASLLRNQKDILGDTPDLPQER